MGGDSGFKLPETPIIAAGAFGGPFCMYTVSPFRNAMSIVAQDSSLSLRQAFRTVFATGPSGGWIGGGYPAVAACPQYLCLGPAYHFFASFAGTLGGIVLAGATESCVLYGAETKAGQLAINASKPGHIPTARMASPFIPWGPGIGLNFMRNVTVLSGMRLINEPIGEAVAKVAGKGPVVTVFSDLLANLVGAGLTMPMHMVYQFVITSGPDLWDKPQAEQNKAMVRFVRNAYFPNGKLSSNILRDYTLRAGYIATAFTMYMQIEKACIHYWPK